MKKNLTVGMPLAVPTQKKPPSKYASHPYPVLVNEALNVSLTVLDFTNEVIPIYEPAYQLSMKPLDFTLKDLVLRVKVDDKDGLLLDMRPLDFTLERVVLDKKIYIDAPDVFDITIKPLDFLLKNTVITHKVDSRALDSYQITIKPLDFTKK